MSTHHISLYDFKRNKPVLAVLKQELITYEQTEYGLKISKLERQLTGKEHSYSYSRSSILLSSVNQEG